jgi:type I restriction enzyme, S subunit
MSALPKGWVETLFSEVFDIKGGTQPPKSEFSSVQRPNDIRLLQIRDFGSDAKAVYIPNSDKWSKCDAEDILIGRYGASVGKILTGKAGAYNVALVRVIFNKTAVDPRWVYNFLKTDHFQNPIALLSRSAQNGFNREDLAGIPLQLPPLPEQQRIVAKVDGLMSRTARARKDLAHIPTLITRYKQRLLALAFSGELTADWRVKQPAASSQNSNPNGLWDIPISWEWQRVDQVGKVGLGRQRSPKNHEGPDMRRYLRSANITWKGIDVTDVKEMNFDAQDFKRFQLKYGDVLLNEGSGSAKEVGKPAIWRDEIPNCCYQNTILRVQPIKCSSEYLYWYFLLTAMSERFVDSTKGMNIQHISKDGLARYLVPFPTPPEQTEIVRRIEAAFAWLDRLAANHTSATNLLPKLDAAILTKAFSGHLVPQNPTDEPASVLLARVKAKRGAMPVKGRGRKSTLEAKKTMPITASGLRAKLDEWPDKGLTFESLYRQYPGQYEALKDAVFELLRAEPPELIQALDTGQTSITLKRQNA